MKIYKSVFLIQHDLLIEILYISVKIYILYDAMTICAYIKLCCEDRRDYPDDYFIKKKRK